MNSDYVAFVKLFLSSICYINYVYEESCLKISVNLKKNLFGCLPNKQNVCFDY